MNRIYWDTMLFVYWLEDRNPFSARIEAIYKTIRARGDRLVTSVFTVGELLVGPRKVGDTRTEGLITEFFDSWQVSLLPFDRAAVDCYGSIRAATSVSPADAIHLACASSVGVDLFLTNDHKLRGLVIPNIHFIDGLGTTVLG